MKLLEVLGNGLKRIGNLVKHRDSSKKTEMVIPAGESGTTNENDNGKVSGTKVMPVPVVNEEIGTFLTTKKLAKILDISPGTLGRMAQLGNIPSIRFGEKTKWKFNKFEVEDWLRSKHMGAKNNVSK